MTGLRMSASQYSITKFTPECTIHDPSSIHDFVLHIELCGNTSIVSFQFISLVLENFR